MRLHVAFGMAAMAFYCGPVQAQAESRPASPDICASAQREYKKANSAVHRDEHLADVSRQKQPKAPQDKMLLDRWRQDLDRLGHAIDVEAEACRPADYVPAIR